MDQSATVTKVTNAMLCMQRHSWEQGIAGHALMALGRIDLCEFVAREAVKRQLPDGRFAVMGDAAYVVDPAANGENVLALYQRTKEPELGQALTRLQDWLDRPEHRASDGTPLHRYGPNQIWADTFYMVPPFLAAIGQETRALEQIECLHRRLWLPDSSVYGHIWDESLGKWERKVPWGCGNGWAIAGIVRTLVNGRNWSPSQSKRLVELATAAIDGCLAFQRADGLFHFVLDDPTSFVETNFAQMMAYAVYELGCLGVASARLVETADRLRTAANSKVDSRGLCQGVCDSPRFESSGTSAEGQAFYLLMETSASKMYAMGKKK